MTNIFTISPMFFPCIGAIERVMAVPSWVGGRLVIGILCEVEEEGLDGVAFKYFDHTVVNDFSVVRDGGTDTVAYLDGYEYGPVMDALVESGVCKPTGDTDGNGWGGVATACEFSEDWLLEFC